jgi:hypothetical protein
MGDWKSLAKASGTGWKEIYRTPGSGGWKELQIAGSLDVGDSCINRNTATTPGYSWLVTVNPANISGTLTSVCVWFGNASLNVHLFTADRTTGNNFYIRAVQDVGDHGTGLRNIAVELEIVAGDYVGIYTEQNGAEESTDKSADIFYKLGVVEAGNTYLFTKPVLSVYGLSVYGTG